MHGSRIADWGDAVPAVELTKGFPFEGHRIKLVSWGRGVFKPEALSDGPLTLVSSLASKYEDEHLEGDSMLYDFAPKSFDWANDGLKRIGELGRPMVLLTQVKRFSRGREMGISYAADIAPSRSITSTRSASIGLRPDVAASRPNPAR